MPGRVCTPSLVRRARDRWPALGVVYSAPRLGEDAAPLSPETGAPMLLAGVDVVRGPCPAVAMDLKLRGVLAEVRQSPAALALGADGVPAP